MYFLIPFILGERNILPLYTSNYSVRDTLADQGLYSCWLTYQTVLIELTQYFYFLKLQITAYIMSLSFMPAAYCWPEASSSNFSLQIENSSSDKALEQLNYHLFFCES